MISPPPLFYVASTKTDYGSDPGDLDSLDLEWFSILATQAMWGIICTVLLQFCNCLSHVLPSNSSHTAFPICACDRRTTSPMPSSMPEQLQPIGYNGKVSHTLQFSSYLRSSKVIVHGSILLHSLVSYNQALLGCCFSTSVCFSE